jgi:hypothetical protein
VIRRGLIFWKGKLGVYRILFFIIICVISIVGILVFLVTKDDNLEKFSDHYSKDLFKKIVMSSFSDQEISLKAEELSSILNFIVNSKLKNKDSDDESKKVMLKGINIFLEKENKNKEVAVYLPITYKGTHVGIIAKSKISVSDQICVEVLESKFGKLWVPRFIFFSLLKNKIPQDWSLEDNKIYIPSTLRFDISGCEVILKIESLFISDSDIKLKLKANNKNIVSDFKDIFNKMCKLFT